MKRFWTNVAVDAGDGGFVVMLDGRPLKTPKKRTLTLPNQILADKVAAEWTAVEGDIKPLAMPLTGLANAAVDIVSDNQAGFAADLAKFGMGDFLCYRAATPEPLVELQAQHWDPLLRWAEGRYDIAFNVTEGVMHVAQAPEVGERIGTAYAALSPYALSALSPMVTLSGSAIIPLAVAHGGIGLDAAWEAAVVDEKFQAELWGEDPEAMADRESRRIEFAQAALFLQAALYG